MNKEGTVVEASILVQACSELADIRGINRETLAVCMLSMGLTLMREVHKDPDESMRLARLAIGIASIVYDADGVVADAITKARGPA